MEAESQLRIAITPEEMFTSEADYIREILDRGWDMVHLRHPSASLRDMQNLIESLPQNYHKRLRLHGHFELLNHFKLGGIHLNRRCPSAPDNYSGPRSRSCHSLAELTSQAAAECDYVTLSPIFDSISKAGYKSAFTKKELQQLDKIKSSGVNIKVIALGGINADNASEVSDMGFDGYAVLGALMSAPDIDDLRRRLRQFEDKKQQNKTE